jgi:hypothetical protein
LCFERVFKERNSVKITKSIWWSGDEENSNLQVVCPNSRRPKKHPWRQTQWTSQRNVKSRRFDKILLDNGRRITIRETHERSDCSIGTVHRIITINSIWDACVPGGFLKCWRTRCVFWVTLIHAMSVTSLRRWAGFTVITLEILEIVLLIFIRFYWNFVYMFIICLFTKCKDNVNFP